jgi:hypothetical protein
VALATTVRVCTAAGGLFAAGVVVPKTACFAGATGGATARTGALAAVRWSTLTMFLATGCAAVNA